MSLNLKKYNVIFFIFLCLLFTSSFLELDDDLAHITQQYSTLLMLVGLISFSCMVYDILYLIYNHHTKKFIFSKENKALAHKIKSLNYEEKNILSIYINNEIQEKALNPNDSAVAWLESVKFIIYTGK
ncbi:MAG: super-infection exclusion protein B, partial [Acinetobacter sp.]